MVKARSYLLLAAKLGVAALAFAFILSRQSWPELRAALLQLSPLALLLATLAHGSGLLIGTLRWRALMRAYGAPPPASFGMMLRTYAVGDFYNVYVPGAVGGDILRGVVTRRAFPRAGTAGALAVVLIERGLGLGAVLTLTAFAAALSAQSKLGAAVLPYCLLGVGAVACGVLAITHGAKVARFAPRALARLLASLPRLEAVGPFSFACLLSLGTQAVEVVCGHVLIASLSRSISFSQSLLALPMATAAGFIPVSVAGIGPRDVALVALYESLGVARADAAVTAIAYSLVTLIVAGCGGVLQLFAPLSAPPTAPG
jgi:uncharacterized membrane protein YbhN (UPF0104 family)